MRAARFFRNGADVVSIAPGSWSDETCMWFVHPGSFRAGQFDLEAKTSVFASQPNYPGFG